MRLVVERGALAGSEFRVQKAQVVIGRDAENGVALAEQGVSRQHARLQMSRSGQGGAPAWYLVDLGTTNGTFLNGRRIPAHEPQQLQPGDRVSVGSSVLVVRDVETVAPAHPQADAGPLIKLPLPARAAAALLFVIALVLMVALLVAVLEPAPRPQETIAPAPENPLDPIMTVIPTGMPGELQEPLEQLLTNPPSLPLLATPAP